MNSEPLFTYRDRSYPNGELGVYTRGDFLVVEYSSDGYNVDAQYVPLDKIIDALKDFQ